MGPFDPPLFVVDDDVCSFDSLPELLAYLEPWDVDSSTRAFDATGRRIRLAAHGVVRTRWTVSGGGTVVDMEASGEDCSAALAELLRDYLGLIGQERSGMTMDEVRRAPLSSLVPLAHRWSRCS